jgi:2-oxoglutarate ferredoxin oxidoreductase subunit beta
MFLAERGVAPENYVFVSGIGCSSRFPYYMNTYGFHSIHGRAPAIATGVKIANPELSVWVVTGDGDALSIGGNHLVHALRRNFNVNIILLNNRIYGLTKGQYSPTSEFGKVTKSSPSGSPDYPLSPLLLALGSQATFVARTLDVDMKHIAYVLREADRHQGTSLIEVYQNCAIYNDGAFDLVRDRATREDNRLLVEHGVPLIFGKHSSKGLRLKSKGAKIVEFDPKDPYGPQKAGVTIFDRHNPNYALILARMPRPPRFPVPMGVLYEEKRPTHEGTLQKKAAEELLERPLSDNADENLQELFSSGDTWFVE